jgi:hypothetical protein
MIAVRATDLRMAAVHGVITALFSRFDVNRR